MPSDVGQVAERIRHADEQEVWASHHKTPLQAISESFEASDICLTVERAGRPILIGGVCPSVELPGAGSIWLLGTDEIDQVAVSFVRLGQASVRRILDYYPIVHNWVDARNVKSLGWIKLLGAEIEDARPWGAECRPFHHFIISREGINHVLG